MNIHAIHIYCKIYYNSDAVISIIMIIYWVHLQCSFPVGSCFRVTIGGPPWLCMTLHMQCFCFHIPSEYIVQSAFQKSKHTCYTCIYCKIYYNSDAVISIIMIIYVAYELYKPSKRKAHSKTPQTVNPVYDYDYIQ